MRDFEVLISMISKFYILISVLEITEIIEKIKSQVNVSKEVKTVWNYKWKYK